MQRCEASTERERSICQRKSYVVAFFVPSLLLSLDLSTLISLELFCDSSQIFLGPP
ncbi:hypothetical protein JHK86_022583 [Glycine max]|nr:hypothetical protein JHK86_022583 [Glycine max]